MVRYVVLGLLALTFGFVTSASAGKHNRKINIGDAAPSFEKLPATDGKSYSLADFKDKDVLVVTITCNHCPVAVAYEDRIIELAKKFGSDKVAVVAINVNNREADKLPKMIERAKEKGFNFPYLYDESQQIGRALGASVTPEFFVFDKERKLVYTGAFDDSQRSPKTHYVEDAIKAVLGGSTVEVAETKPRGCGVGYDKR